MKITEVSTTVYRIPPTVSWEDATHIVSGLEFIIVKIKTNTGLIGTGLSYTVGIGGSAIKALIDDYIVNMVIGKDPCNIEEIWNDLFRQLHRCGTGGINSLALAAIDVGLWDILGKYYDKPLYKLIGGARDRIPAYGSGIDFNLSLNELLELVDGYVIQGYQTVKIKIGKDHPEEDVERIIKVKERLGPARRLLVDANQKWNAAEAIQVFRDLDQYQLGWIEEPISSEDIEGHTRLRRSMTTPLAIGESLYNKYQFLDYLKAGAVDIVQADVARVGGITEWIKIAHLADAWHRPMAPHFLMELSVHLLCGVPNGLILENVSGGSLSEMGVLEVPFTAKNGFCVPPDDPGHGIRLNDAALEPFRFDAQKLKNANFRSNKL